MTSYQLQTLRHRSAPQHHHYGASKNPASKTLPNNHSDYDDDDASTIAATATATGTDQKLLKISTFSSRSRSLADDDDDLTVVPSSAVSAYNPTLASPPAQAQFGRVKYLAVERLDIFNLTVTPIAHPAAPVPEAAVSGKGARRRTHACSSKDVKVKRTDGWYGENVTERGYRIINRSFGCFTGEADVNVLVDGGGDGAGRDAVVGRVWLPWWAKKNVFGIAEGSGATGGVVARQDLLSDGREGLGELVKVKSDNLDGNQDKYKRLEDGEMEWETLTKLSPWIHSVYGFEWEVEFNDGCARTERRKFEWRRTRLRIWDDQDDLELVAVDEFLGEGEGSKSQGGGRVYATYDCASIWRWRRRGVLSIFGMPGDELDGGGGGGEEGDGGREEQRKRWEWVVVATGMALVELARRRARMRRSRAAGGAGGGC